MLRLHHVSAALSCACKWALALPVLSLIAMLCIGSFASATEEPALEYQVKAAFLYNFAKFIEWPATKLPSSDAPLIIGLVGPDPFGSTLDQVVQGKTINGHKVIVRRFAPGEDFTQCNLLFIGRSLKDSVVTILDKLKGQNVLTVSEIEKFARRGGCINFIIVNESVNFQINLQAAERAGLKVSSKLLSVAKVVEDENKPASPGK